MMILKWEKVGIGKDLVTGKQANHFIQNTMQRKPKRKVGLFGRNE